MVSSITALDLHNRGGVDSRPPAARVLDSNHYDFLSGTSHHVQDLKRFISDQAMHHEPVMITGPRGLRHVEVARAIHEISQNCDDPVLVVQPGLVSGESLYDRLFGELGVLSVNQRGTIIISQMVDLPLSYQQRFVYYLKDEIKSNSRSQKLIFITDVDNDERAFRYPLSNDLLELLKQHSFALMPLRERSEDLPYLIENLVNRTAARLNKGPCQIAPKAMTLLLEHEWAGNIDELEVAVNSLVSSLPPQVIDENALPSYIKYARLKLIPPGGIDLPRVVDEYEQKLIETALRQSSGNKSKASRLLKLREQTLYAKLKRYNKQQPDLLDALSVSDY